MAANKPFNILVFSKTTGFRHPSIPAGISALHSLSTRTGFFAVDASEDASIFAPASLARYSVIVLLHTIGDIFNQTQLDALKEFVRGGGGVVAIHGAVSGMPGDEWYGKLIGVHFDMHPPAEPGTVLVEEENQNHLIIQGQSGREGWMDEWYNFRTHPRKNENLKVLLKGDTKTFKGGKLGDDHPLSWCQEFEGGRSFYTGLGHFDEAYKDKWFTGQILKGILWAAKREDALSTIGADS